MDKKMEEMEYEMREIIECREPRITEDNIADVIEEFAREHEIQYHEAMAIYHESL